MSYPLYQKIYDDVMEKIRNGALKVGDKIPSEKELADEFNVSRITSKKALDLLAQEKVIERIQGKGSFVSKQSTEQQKDIIDDVNIPVHVTEAESYLIGLVIEDFEDSYGTYLLKSLEDYCTSLQSHLIIKRTDGRMEREQKAIQDLLSLGVDGIIIYPNHGEYYNQKVLELVINQFPIVYIDRYIKGLPVSSVCTDNKQAAKRATDYLFSLGHKEIAIISRAPDGTSAIDERIQGFHVAFSEQGIKLNPQYVLSYKDDISFEKDKWIKDKLKVMEKFILENPIITAFVVCEYGDALCLDHVIKQMGKRVPEDYSIICFDSPNQIVDVPHFTHIKQDEGVIAEEALNLIMSQFRGNPSPKNLLIDFSLVEGKSTRMIK